MTQPNDPYGSPANPYGAPQGAGGPYGAPPTGPGYGYGAPKGAASPDDLSLPLYGASFGQAVRRFFKKYATFTGRASRSEYWWVALFSFLVQLVPMILIWIGVGIGTAWQASHMPDNSSVDIYGNGYQVQPAAVDAPGAAALMLIGGILLVIVALALIVPTLAITWRRLHDANLAGPLFFLGLIPSVGWIIVLVFTLLPPKAEGQRFDVRR